MQDALHVVQPGNKYVKWDVCSDPVNNNWALSDYYGDTTALYSTLYAHPLRPKGFRILVYSGDADGVSDRLLVSPHVLLFQFLFLLFCIRRYVLQSELSIGYIASREPKCCRCLLLGCI